MARHSKRLQEIRNTIAPSPKAHVSKKAKLLRTKEAFTSLQCCNIMNKSIFVEGLQKAGLDVVPRPFGDSNDPTQVAIAVQSREDARQIVKAFHGSPMEGRAMKISIIDLGILKGRPQLPKLNHIRRCVNDAFHRRASKKEVPELAINRKKADENLVMEKGAEKATQISDSTGDESGGLVEQIYKQESGERPCGMRGDSLRPEPSAMQQTRAGEMKSDLRGERCQIQDTARMITPTRSPTPEDFLSALLAYLDEGKDAVIDKSRASTPLTT